MDRGYLETVVAELERNNTGTEISVPDETSSVSHRQTSTNGKSELQEETSTEQSKVRTSQKTESNSQMNETKTDINSADTGNVKTDHDTVVSISSRKSETVGEQSSDRIKDETKLETSSDERVADQSTDYNISKPVQLKGTADKETNDSNTVIDIANLENITNNIPATEARIGDENNEKPSAGQTITHEIRKDTAKTQVSNRTSDDHSQLLNIPEKAEAEKVNSEDIANKEDMQYRNIASVDHKDDLPANGIAKDEIVQTQTSEVAKLTRENLKQHTKILREAVSKTPTIQSENKEAENANDEVSDQQKDNAISITNKGANNELEACEKEIDENKPETVSKTVSIENVTQPDSKPDNVTLVSSKVSLLDKRISRNAEVKKHVNNTSSPIPGHSKYKPSIKEPQKSKVKRKVKKKQKISVDDVETLVSRDKRSISENRKPRKTVEEADSVRDNIQVAENNNLIHEDSGIEKDIEEHNDPAENVAVHSGTEEEKLPDGGTAEENCLDTDHAIEGRRLLRRVKQRKYAKRPVYDAMNTSTQMILLNNKYGKHSRLWKTRDDEPRRSNLIDPSRHLKEATFYLSGDFHSRCSTFASPVRYNFPPSHFKFDFSDRPQSDKIGDRLYTARLSVNPNRHRTCNSTPERKLRPLDFSPPYRKDALPTYVFEWERLYAEPPSRPSRPSSLVRPPSIISGKKFGKETVKIPHVLHESMTK